MASIVNYVCHVYNIVHEVRNFVGHVYCFVRRGIAQGVRG